MAENVYEINLYNKNPESSKSAVAGTQKEKKPAEDKADGTRAILGAMAALDKAKPYIRQAISSEINIVQITTGRNEYAEKMRFGMQVGNFLLDTAESVAAGFVVGNVPGAVISAITAVGLKTYSLALSQKELYAEQSVENVSRALRAQRIGYDNSRGSNQ